MVSYTQEITLDINTNTAYPIVSAKQGDEGSRWILVHLTKDNIPYSATPGNNAQFRCRKPDGHAIINPAIINNDGSIGVELTAQTLISPGRAYADIVESDENGNILSSVAFILLIMAAPNVASNATSSDEFQKLNELVSRSDELIAQAEAWAIGTKNNQDVGPATYEQDTNVTIENFESKKSHLFIKDENDNYILLDESAIFDSTQIYYILTVGNNNNAKYYSEQAQVAKKDIEDLGVSATTLGTGEDSTVNKIYFNKATDVNADNFDEKKSSLYTENTNHDFQKVPDTAEYSENIQYYYKSNNLSGDRLALLFGLPAGGKGDRGPTGVWVGNTEPPTSEEVNVWINPEGTSDSLLLTAEQVIYNEQVEYGEESIGATVKNLQTNIVAATEAAERASKDAADAAAAAGQVTVIGNRVSTLETDIVKKIENPNLEKTQEFGILVVKYIKDEVTSENFDSKKSYLFIKDYEEDTNVTAENFESKKPFLFIKVDNEYNSLDDSAIFDNTQTYYVLIYISLDESAVFNSEQIYYKKENQWQEKLDYGQDLNNLPYLNEVELKGNLTLNNLGIAPAAPSGKDYYVLPDDGIPKNSLDSSVQASLGLADNAATQIIVNNNTYHTEENVINLGNFLTDNNTINKNYLDNPWFTINQRGIISYSSTNPAKTGTHLYDRWKVITNETEDRAIRANKNLLYIGETIQGDENDSIVIGQLIDDNTWNSLSNKQVTASVNYSFDGITFKTVSWSFTCQQYDLSSSKLYRKQFDKDIGWGAQVLVQEFNSKKYLVFEIFWKGNAWEPTVEDSTIYITKTKLELGGFSTLDQEAMPLYDEELKKCQKYLRYYGGQGAKDNNENNIDIILGTGIARDSNTLDVVFPDLGNMVNLPSVTLPSGIELQARRGLIATTTTNQPIPVGSTALAMYAIPTANVTSTTFTQDVYYTKATDSEVYTAASSFDPAIASSKLYYRKTYRQGAGDMLYAVIDKYGTAAYASYESYYVVLPRTVNVTEGDETISYITFSAEP